MKHKLLQTWARKSAKLLAAVALLATTSFASMAADYTIFPSTNLSDWTGADKNTGGVTSGKGGYSSTYTDPTDNVQFKITLGDANDSKKPTDTQIQILQNHTTTISSETVDMTKIVMTNTTGNARAFILNSGWSQSNSDDKKTITFTNTNGAKYFSAKLSSGKQIVVSSIVVTSASAAPSTELGDIMYGSEAADNKDLSGFKGDVFTFSADNAENMTITVDPANTGVVSSFENGSISWTAPAVEEETPVMLTVKATKGAAEKEATVMVTINKAHLCGMPAFSTAGTITKGSSVTISCEHAKQIKYWISENANDAEADAQTVDAPATVTINQNCYLHACGINADGIAGETSSVQYTVTEPTTAEFDFTNAESINAAEGSEGIGAENNTKDDSKNNLNGKSLKKNGITLSFSVGTNANGNKPRWWEKAASQGGGTELRIYTDNTLTVTAENGKKLSKITMNGKVAMNASAGTISNGVWTPSASVQTIARAEGDITSVVLTPTANCKISSIAVDYANSTPTGIAGIEAENGEAVYFNLQGVRVQNPENGIFIRVQNGKALKIMK